MATSLYPGVACALDDSDTSPGRCTDGQGGDDPYNPFFVRASDPIEAAFNQPLNRGTVLLGAACGAGTVRVEAVDAGGNCVAPVSGTLVRRARGFQFTPTAPWTPGQRYRMVLVPGGNDGCDAGNLCGANGRALNTDALDGTEGGQGGGPNLVIPFEGAPDTSGTFVPAQAFPFSDINGNGFLDAGEIPRDENRAAMRITDADGITGGASLAMEDCIPATPEVEGCMYISASMPVVMGELEENCDMGALGTADRCIPAQIFPQVIYGTSLRMDTGLFGIDVDTGQMVIRVREQLGVPLMGYVIEQGGVAQMVAVLDMYMDAPDMSIPLASHDLQSKPISVIVAGPLGFLPDGRIQIRLSNVAAVSTSVQISTLGLDVGNIFMEIPAGEMKLQLVSPPLKGAEL
jgi:hypothetical protein